MANSDAVSVMSAAGSQSIAGGQDDNFWRRDCAGVAYGTPAGKAVWKTQANFEKFFGFTSNAGEAFPDRSGNPAAHDACAWR